MEKYSKEYYQSINKDESTQASKLAEVIKEMYRPNSVIDIGCGTGLYLKDIDCYKFGFDFSKDAFDPEVIQVKREFVVTRDLTQPFEPKSKFDIAICFEVLEHIGSEYSDIIAENISKYADILIVTASPPGQAGLNHVNCQPQWYWNEKFEKLGFHRDYFDEYQIVSKIFQVHHTIWIIRNLMVYKKNEN